MPPLGDDILAIQWEASRALDFEVSGHYDAAMEAYSRSTSQLQYLLDVVVDGRTQQDLAAVCRGLLASYSRRLQVLSSVRQRRPGMEIAGGSEAAAEPQQWLHLDAAASAASTSDDCDGSGGDRRGAAAPLLRAPTPPPPLLTGGRVSAAPLQQHWTMPPLLPAPLCGPATAAGCAFGDGGGGYCAAAVANDPCAAHAPQWAAPAVALPVPQASGGAQQELGDAAAAAAEVLRQCRRVVTGSLEDVVGLECVKEELEEAVFLPMRYPHLFKGIRRPPRNFLLYGPPGTGKTLLVEKVAAEAGLLLLALSPSVVLSKWSGEAEKAVRAAFEAARRAAPSAVFIDEIDALGRSRGGGGGAGASGDDSAGRRLLTELLLQMNALASSVEDDVYGSDDLGDASDGGGGGASVTSGVYVFAATNRMADCDPALLRRFERRIEVPLPDATARAAFLSSVLSRPEVGSALSPGEVAAIAAATDGYSGSDMACLCRHAAMAPVRELMAAARQARGRARTAAAKRRRVVLGPMSGSGGEGGDEENGSKHEEGELMESVAVGDGVVGHEVPDPAAALLAPGAAVRKLVAADFEAALLVIRPSAVDAAAPASC